MTLTDAITDAYARANDGDMSGFRALIADDYVHHVPFMEAEVKGGDAAAEWLSQTYAAFGIRQQPRQIIDHGDRVVAVVEGTLDVDGAATPFTHCHAFVMDGGRATACWII